MAPCGRGSLALRALRRQLFSPIRVDIGTIDIRICNPLIALTTVLAYFRPKALLALGAPTTVLADRCTTALLALIAPTTVLADCTPSALLAQRAPTTVLAE